MSALRSIIEEFVSPELDSLTDGELSDDAAEISRAIDLLAHRLAWITFEVARRGCHQVAGFLNVTRWLAVIGDMDDTTARRYVGLGRVLAKHSETNRRAASRELSGSRLRILARAARAHPELYHEHEGMLLDFADSLSLADLRKAVDYWSNCADEARAEDEADERRDETYLHASRTFAGMLKLDGLFDKETGEVILTALEAAMNEEARRTGSSEDLRPAPQRRADALHDICRQFLDHFPGKIGGNRPHVAMIIDLDTLNGGEGKRCELAKMGTITPEAARRILCDAELSRFITDGDSVILDMGRSTRTVTPEQFRALALRDGGCTYKGCDRPPEWCDAHHKRHWLDGGTTDLDNLCLLCRRHHVLVHRLERNDRTFPPEWLSERGWAGAGRGAPSGSGSHRTGSGSRPPPPEP